jgi:putative methionine-R-sulfoxide reductase with GAF domain
MNRPYEQLADRLRATSDRMAAMQTFVDAAWELLAPTGVSWIGFYLQSGTDEMVLGPRRDKPACSPIGLHGVCGQAFTSRLPRVVEDVRTLGPNYIACDPRDQSEVVLPLFDAQGTCWGVLDVDSYDIGAFTEADVQGLGMALRRAGLTR